MLDLEFLGLTGLSLAVAILLVRLVLGPSRFSRGLLIASALTLPILLAFNTYYLAVFGKAYGIEYFAPLPFTVLLIGSKTIAGVKPGLLYVDYTWFITLYMLIELKRITGRGQDYTMLRRVYK